ncbi:MAG: DUF1937 family protein [Planctomycetota bacterium]
MKKDLDQFAFLASPYSTGDALLREHRFRLACRAVAWLWQYYGLPVYSPISHSHAIAMHSFLDPLDPFWYVAALTMLRHASELWVLLLDGWQGSKGVQGEFCEAVALKLPIHYIRYEKGEFREVEKP